jgi:hypothetical protein
MGYNLKADVYSLGIILFYLFFKRAANENKKSKQLEDFNDIHPPFVRALY